ncbi:MAG: pseudouridine synthase [Myxococcota bacterium]
MINESELLYRDHAIVALNKRSGLAVHRGDATDRVTALTEVRNFIGQWVYPIHRLDRGTSGVLLFAIDSQWAAEIQKQFNDGVVLKRYVALCRGVPTSPNFIDHAIPRAAKGPRVAAQTRLKVCEKVSGPLERSYGWVSLEPLTGRRHQLRRHLKHISHPIVGDVKYGDGRVNRAFREGIGLRRIALHAAELRIRHPESGAPIAIEATLPPDLTGPLAQLGVEAAVRVDSSAQGP